MLKEIRQKIADENDIPFVVSECKYKGDCKGTCPKCEAELAYLEKELQKRKKAGKQVMVAGLATAAVVLALQGCNANINDMLDDILSTNCQGALTADFDVDFSQQK